ncbi:hypothetical protein K523DRAFT_143963 [Schizophyllum commune Tattone D]|nr:hypothetical protein K523DRAFT_143963 [Schizophyllum commune Tattone D]
MRWPSNSLVRPARPVDRPRRRPVPRPVTASEWSPMPFSRAGPPFDPPVWCPKGVILACYDAPDNCLTVPAGGRLLHGRRAASVGDEDGADGVLPDMTRTMALCSACVGGARYGRRGVTICLSACKHDYALSLACARRGGASIVRFHLRGGQTRITTGDASEGFSRYAGKWRSSDEYRKLRIYLNVLGYRVAAVSAVL